MTQEAFLAWAKSIALKQQFTIGQILYSANHRAPNELRNIILNVVWQGQPAVMKLYDDPRLIHESHALQSFHHRNTSQTLTAPKLYASGITSPSRGWIIMEKLPDTSQRFTVPMTPVDRLKFLDIFLDYRTHFPITPDRELNMVEQLPSADFQRLRVDRWLERATIAEVERGAQNQPTVLSPAEFLPLFRRGVSIMNEVFAERPMIWCHGHFKPQEIFIVNEKVYVTDFGHMSMFPEGYELGFIIWADYLVGAPWNMSDKEWDSGLDDWLAIGAEVAEKLHYSEPKRLLLGTVIERILGSILGDICASDRPIEEQRGRLSHLMPALSRLINSPR